MMKFVNRLTWLLSRPSWRRPQRSQCLTDTAASDINTPESVAQREAAALKLDELQDRVCRLANHVQALTGQVQLSEFERRAQEDATYSGPERRRKPYVN
jgi:hypothetical protein